MKRALAIFVILLLGLAVANLAIAIRATHTTTTSPGANLFDAEAAAAGWPAPTPLEWPRVSQWSDETAFAYRHRNAISATDSQTTHQMQFEEFGWPLPVLERVQLWWPWDDPKWSTTVPNDSGLVFRWSGTLLNPVLQAGVIWLILFAPPLVWGVLLRRRRRARGQCLACAYPLGGARVCPECGVAASEASG